MSWTGRWAGGGGGGGGRAGGGVSVCMFVFCLHVESFLEYLSQLRGKLSGRLAQIFFIFRHDAST